ncbi:MAG TPA: hypothetical protein VKH61_16815 [Streptosporangiaceae bacterium]|nr:hypothetical protein [Streptosporangiaceae bacterium]
MYQPYPGGDQPPAQSGQFEAPVRAPIPQSVTRAVQVMYLGALASLVGIIIELLTRHSLRTFIADHATRNGNRLTATQVADTYHAELVVLVVVGLIAVGLWIWMAQSNKAGKNWARITSTVFFALDTLGAIGGLAGGALSGGSVNRFYGLVVWVIGAAAIILLWQRTSTEYFKSAPR